MGNGFGCLKGENPLLSFRCIFITKSNNIQLDKVDGGKNKEEEGEKEYKGGLEGEEEGDFLTWLRYNKEKQQEEEEKNICCCIFKRKKKKQDE